MITIDHDDNLISVVVLGEFTLADFQEFESLVSARLQFHSLINVLFDLQQMASVTLDVAVEEIRFSRSHAQDFGRIAVVTDSEWVAWSTWLNQLFVDAEIEVFDNQADARLWLADGNE